jgi:hypothetical protein
MRQDLWIVSVAAGGAPSEFLVRLAPGEDEKLARVLSMLARNERIGAWSLRSAKHAHGLEGFLVDLEVFLGAAPGETETDWPYDFDRPTL